MPPLIKLEQVSHRFADHDALQQLDLELQCGEVLGLLGVNGAGKSTCLRIIGGALTPSAGRVLIDGIDLQREPLQAKRRIGFLPERPPLYPELTVDEYLRFCARLHHLDHRQQLPAMARVKSHCGLNRVGQRLIANLSDGYQQRIGIAQALIHRPKLVILDEPTSRLDPNQTSEVRTLIAELGDTHGVILSTHILPEVAASCSRVAILHDGRLRYDGPLDNTRPDAARLLLMVLERAPERQALLQLPGIEQVEILQDNHVQLRLDNTAQLSQIAEQAVRSGWGLVQLTPQQPGLEQLFSQLTSQEGTQ